MSSAKNQVKNQVKNHVKNHANEITYEISDIQTRSIKSVSNNGTFLFNAYGCALLERQTDSGMYAYTAVNLSTKKTVTLSRRKRKLDESAFEVMAEKIYESDVCGDSRFCVEKEPDGLRYGRNRESAQLKLSPSEIMNHIFTEVLPMYGYSLRERQLELAEHILGVIERRGVTLAEAEVGTGKTHAYLIAGFLAKRGRINDSWLRGHYPRQGWAESAHMPVVISTSSIALQQAIVSDYIPELSDILLQQGIINKPIVAVIRKGKEHYVCESRLERYYKRADIATKRLLGPYRNVGIDKASAPNVDASVSVNSDTDVKAAAKNDVKEAAKTEDDTNNTFDLTNAVGLSSYTKRAICVSGRCNVTCPYKDKCRYNSYIKMANGPAVDFQITNQHPFQKFLNELRPR